MPTMTLEEAQAQLAEVIARLAVGEELRITQGDQTVARLVAEPRRDPNWVRPGPGLMRGMITIVEDDDEHLKDFAEYMP